MRKFKLKFKAFSWNPARCRIVWDVLQQRPKKNCLWKGFHLKVVLTSECLKFNNLKRKAVCCISQEDYLTKCSSCWVGQLGQDRGPSWCDDDDQVGDECVDSLRLSTVGILNRAKTNSQNVKVLLFLVVQITRWYKVFYILFTCHIIFVFWTREDLW